MMRRRLISLVLAVVMSCAIMPEIHTDVMAHTAVMTADEFVDSLKIALSRENVYNNQYPYNLGYYDGSKISWDCWNLGKSIIWTKGEIVYNYSVDSYARPDTSCGLGDWDGKTIIMQAPNCGSDFSNLVPGEWLYLEGHTGYYIGDGQVIECTTSWGVNGITQSQIDSNGNRSRNGVSGGKWLYHGMVPWIDYETKALITVAYPAYCSIEISSSTTYVKSLPCSKATDPNSLDVEKASKGDSYQAIGLVENTAGNLWYKVTAKNGSVGYIYAGDTQYVAQSIHDIKETGITAPTNHIAGSSYVLTGTVSSTYNQLTAVSAYVYAGTSEQGTIETGDTASVSGNYFSLGGSSIDKQTKFGTLPVGTHTYVVCASYKSYYAKSATSLGTKTGEIGIYKETFRVIDGPATCSHSYVCEMTKESTCLVDGVWTYTCSKCGASYTEPLPATGYHSWGAWGVKQEATCTTGGVKTRKCYVCWEDEIQEIPPIDHSYGDWTVTTAADCVTDGIKMRLCQYCGHKQTETETAPGHDYDQWTIGLQSSCEMNGEEYRVCQRCADVQTREIQALGHEYVSFTEEPTCEDDGYTYSSCMRCGEVFEDRVIPTIGHDYRDGVCIYCGKQEIDVMLGDLTGDLEITSADTVLLARYLVGQEELDDQQLRAADVNGDGEVTSADTVRLGRYLAGLVDSL